jgi:hypothetical protein
MAMQNDFYVYGKMKNGNDNIYDLNTLFSFRKVNKSSVL